MKSSLPADADPTAALRERLRTAEEALLRAQTESTHLQQLLEATLSLDSERLWEWNASDDRVYSHAPDLGAGGETCERLSDILDDAHPDDQSVLRGAWQRVKSGERDQLDCTFRQAKAMQWRWMRMRGRAVERDAEGRPARVIGKLGDVSDGRRQDEARGLRAQSFNLSTDALWLLDERGQILDSNPAAQALSGFGERELAGRSIRTFIADVPAALDSGISDEPWQAECVLNASAHREVQVQARLTRCPGRLGGARAWLLAARDITAQKLSASALDRLARFDGLTGLPNRHSIKQELETRLSRSAAISHAVLFTNIDQLQRINDALGHDFGDALLTEVARRLTVCAGKDGLVGRWGGDEFVLVISHRNARAEAARIAEYILRQLKQEATVGRHRVSASASVGIAIAPDDGSAPDLLIRRADTAMLAARRARRAGWEYFRQEFDDDSLRRLTLVNLLRQDAERGRFAFVAQPKVNGQGLAVGFELLIRWTTDEFGAVSPAYFIPLAEEIGVIGQLGREAMLAATRLIRGLHDAGCPLPVAVNLSSKQMIDPVLEQALVECCEIEGIDPHWLEVEVTESALLDNLERAKAKLDGLRGHGFKIALDDFGTGFSSLSYLRDLPFDKVKIDKSFVTSMATGARALALTRGIATLCRALGMQTVAEGVETRKEFESLQSIGVDEYQGFLFSRPLPPEQAIAFARRNR